MDTPNNHYRDCVIEPIKVIKAMLTHEQYLGYLLGNVIKYRFRNGHKTDGDLEKAMQYETWYKEEKQNEEVKLPAAPHTPTLLEVVRQTFPDTQPTSDGCPHERKFAPAFKAAGYVRPYDYDCFGHTSCYDCWNRPAELKNATN